tara:strand:+ start:395 stop:787 length:393 start_codon:yes stop_codon:yes gene_type:complete
MTCFWDGITKGLLVEDFKLLGKTKTNRNELIKLLKENNQKTHNVLWNNKKIQPQLLKENYIAVQNYNEKGIKNGHLCSTCDYMLLLICELFNINIEHKYLQKTMKYEKPNNTKKIWVQSNKGHFWFIKRN